MPAKQGRGFDDRDRIDQHGPARCQHREEPAFPGLEPRAAGSPSQDRELLAEQQVLGREMSASRQQSRERDEDIPNQAQYVAHHRSRPTEVQPGIRGGDSSRMELLRPTTTVRP
jgi:hypothetical protein